MSALSLKLLVSVSSTSVATLVRIFHLVAAAQLGTSLLFAFCVPIFTRACDTLHLAPRHHMWMPGLPVLVIIAFPGTSS